MSIKYVTFWKFYGNIFRFSVQCQLGSISYYPDMLLVHLLYPLIFLYSNGYLHYAQKITKCMSFCSLYSTYLPFTYLLNLSLPISQHQFSLSHLKLHTWTQTIKTTQTIQIYIVAYTWTQTTKTTQTTEIHVPKKIGPLQSSVPITLFADTLTNLCNIQGLHLHKQNGILLMWDSSLWQLLGPF